MEYPAIETQVQQACYRLLSELNRDPYAPAYGCFDRRYWGWKLVDYAEATFQRGVYPLAWLYRQAPAENQAGLLSAIRAGIDFALSIQHRDGSFDQAFPNEHSYGATAFLLHPLLEAYKTIASEYPYSWRSQVEERLKRAAVFLCRRQETHGFIANHLAGAALALQSAAAYYNEARFSASAGQILQHILNSQSQEGWFREYDGADPGYQTLCLHYLARYYKLQPQEPLRQALERAIAFLAWFAHPDGTFGGEYGSRRTSVFYPGGVALMADESPLAASLSRFMLKAISEGRTVNLGVIDTGNLVPLLTSTILALDSPLPGRQDLPPLPCEQSGTSENFTEAGLYIRTSQRYYAIFGASNGGVLKIFDCRKKRVIWNDGGYVAQTARGEYLTTQITHLGNRCEAKPQQIELWAGFYAMLRSIPTPLQFVILRMINLTLMRSPALGNLVKGFLARLLISGKRAAPLLLNRQIVFEENHVLIKDTISPGRPIDLKLLAYGQPFVAIHMASARYFDGHLQELEAPDPLSQNCLDDIRAGKPIKIHREVSF